MQKLPMLRVSHCQTALLGNRGGGRGGGGRMGCARSRQQRSEAAATQQFIRQTAIGILQTI